jgi:hypothetical protein
MMTSTVIRHDKRKRRNMQRMSVMIGICVKKMMGRKKAIPSIQETLRGVL